MPSVFKHINFFVIKLKIVGRTTEITATVDSFCEVFNTNKSVVFLENFF